MHLFLALTRTDFRNTFRDPVFRGLLFFPLLAFLLVRLGVPLAQAHFPVIRLFLPVVMMWACLQTAIMFGFLHGFLLLEEKEDGVFQVMRVLPVRAAALIGGRLALGLGMSALINFLMLHAGGVLHLPLWQELLLALQFSLVAPLLTLLLGTLAQNRIQGLAQMKLLNLALIAPGLIYFLPQPLLHLTALVPTYWTFRSLEAALNGSGFFSWWLGGCAVYALVLGGLLFRMKRHSFR